MQLDDAIGGRMAEELIFESDEANTAGIRKSRSS
jgi:ATP-dependent Zn protease